MLNLNRNLVCAPTDKIRRRVGGPHAAHNLLLPCSVAEMHIRWMDCSCSFMSCYIWCLTSRLKHCHKMTKYSIQSPYVVLLYCQVPKCHIIIVFNLISEDFHTWLTLLFSIQHSCDVLSYCMLMRFNPSCHSKIGPWMSL